MRRPMDPVDDVESVPPVGASNVTGRRGAGWGFFVLGCVLAIGAGFVAMTIACPRSTSSSDQGSVMVSRAANREIARWARTQTPPDGVSGVVFGDSVWAPPTEADTRFVLALEPALQQAGVNVKLLDLTHAGFGAYQFYYLSSRVLAGGPPDFAVVEVNLFTFAPDWYGEPLGRFSPMTAGLSLEQVWRVRQALATQQVGLFTPWVYRLDEHIRVPSLLDRVRTQGLATLAAVGNSANGLLGLAAPSGHDRAWATIQRHVKLDARTAELWYGRDFVVSPTAAVLRAFSDDLRAAGVTILYVVSPLQRRTLRQFGIRPDDLHARMDQLRQMLHATPEQWVETTDLFQSKEFIDGVHVRGDLIRRMTPPVVERLVPMIEARQRPRAADGNASASTTH